MAAERSTVLRGSRSGEPQASLGPNVTVGDGASIGHALVDQSARMGRGARVLGNTYVPPGTEIADGEVWTGEEA